MEIKSLDRSVQASDLSLEQLANSDQVSKEEKIGEAARQFESVLLRQILSQAQKPLFKSSLFPSGGTANAIYEDMVTQQLADRISEGGTFGFAKVLTRELTAEYGDKKTALEKTAAAPATSSIEQKISKYKSPAIQPGKRI
jgi:Rod binding domain-containing protein